MSRENELVIEIIKIAIELASIRGNGKETALAKQIIDLVRGDDMDSLRSLLSNNDLSETPIKTSWGAGVMMVDIAVGNDETALLYLHEGAIKLLSNKGESK